ncbi:helix-turn-helix domain-containing protein [Bradyrhizobium sp. UNPA324]|uniref:helix-turn-helix domain-containing protein n=1 Tax=Bradyrhizobium sp. UNPA324 TaxID=1141174 RepID=UPI001150AB63|nr:helix-turn-helix domain-containing protein [Bradyrhizobium sp. UNPA324]
MLPEKYDTTFALKAIGLSDQLNKTEKRVAVALLDHFNRKTARCDPSQQTIAALLGVDRKTVNRAIKKIVRLGYFNSLRHRGSWHCNSYQPCWHRFRADEEKWSADRRKHRSRFDSPEMSPSLRQVCPTTGHEITSQTYPTNIFPLTSSDPQPNAACQVRNGPPAREETQNYIEIVAPRIERRLGSARFKSWFHSVRFEELRKDEIVLSADMKFVAAKIVEQFEPQVLECFRPEHPNLVRLVVIVRAPR